MKPRHADILKESGCTASVEEFRETLIAVKAEKYPDMTDEDLAFTKNQAGDYCAEVNRRIGTKLSRVFILKCLVGIRKARKRRSGQASTSGV
jgi:hypothetical protein